jgi:hypothetical protein
MFPHRNIHKVTQTSPDGTTHNQIDHLLIDRRRHSSILDVRLFMAADYDIDSLKFVQHATERKCMKLSQFIIHTREICLPLLATLN